MDGEDINGVIPIRGYTINGTTGLLLGLVTSLATYLFLIRVDAVGPILNKFENPLMLGLPGIVSCLMCLLPFAVIALYATCMSVGPKGTRSAIS